MQAAATTNQMALIDSPRCVAMLPTAQAPRMAMTNQTSFPSAVHLHYSS